MWEIEYTDEFEDFWTDLSVEQQVALEMRIDKLAAEGPSLKRPIIGEVKTSENDPRMKEIICDSAGSLRVLFIFDPRRTAILLLGGDKSGDWNRWYREAIPEADRLYRIYLQELKDQGLL